MEVNQASFLTSLVSLRYYLVAGWSRLVARWAQCRRKHDPLIAAEMRNESYGGAVQEETSVRSPVKFGETGSGVIPSQALIDESEKV